MSTLDRLPADLQHKIHLTILSDLDVPTVEGPLIHPDRKFWTDTDVSLDENYLEDPSEARWYILDPTVLGRIAFYQALFRLGGPVEWKRHVRFVFRSAIALMDVLSTWSGESLSQIRRLKLFGHPIPIGGPVTYQLFHAHHILHLVHGLRLELFEYEDVYLTHDNGYGWGAVRKTMKALLISNGWRTLHFYSRQPNFLAQDVRTLVALAKDHAWSKNEPDFDFDMPLIPLVRDEFAGHVVGIEGRETWTGINFGEQWVRGRLVWDGDVELQLVARRGKAAKYISDGTGGDEGVELGMPPIPWRDMRRMGIVVGREKLDDPCGYL